MPLNQPPSCYAAKCPLAGKAQGFVLGVGDPERAKFSILLEAPWRQEVVWRLDDPVELARRKKAYPDIPIEFLTRGAPAVESGPELFGWALGALGVRREQVFVDSTLRCALSLRKPEYPTGPERKRAEACCRQYDRLHADIAFINLQPNAVSREPTPLPLQVHTFRKAVDCATQGKRAVVLCGGKAADVWCGASRNPTTWIGHYEWNDADAQARREERRVKGMAIVLGEKVKKVKKLTAKTALALLLGKGVAEQDFGYNFNFALLKGEYEEMLTLTTTKARVKKEKV